METKKSAGTFGAPPGNLSAPEALSALHRNELRSFRKRRKKVIKRHLSGSYARFVLGTTKDYLGFVVYAWARALWDYNMVPTVFLDRVAIISSAALASTVMFFALLWCIFCKFPPVDRLFYLWSHYVLPGVSTANSILPDLFEILSDEEVACACDALSKPISESKDTGTHREFNLDVAKLLLQCSALMYERTAFPLLDALALTTAEESWKLPANLLHASHTAAVNTALHRHPQELKIEDFVARYGLKYQTLSELNSLSSASCGAFWHPDKNFIILAYKGTSPEVFDEYATDLAYMPKHAGGWIHGFGKVHGGFFSKVFPSRLAPKCLMPYTTIEHGVTIIANALLEGKPQGTEINVWTTGHSLGCSVASLVYARQINEPPDLSRSIVMRDGYIFAAPIVCDITSANAFDNQMRRNGRPRTLWRGKDIVATGLPHMGDCPEWGVSASSVFSYAHLGVEISLKPDICRVRGTHVTPGSDVCITTAYNASEKKPLPPDEARRLENMRKRLKLAQWIPVLGQFLSHAPVSYWVALSEVKASHCEWE
ncbi:hypothetical protein AURDEDRAFT_159605 [Auricularia subglabra TFB-10046 SS5]|nr:hypothetical protein AURDEDRAFT_159605 [Auricularia subglabra TFB-10046 SS5]